MSRERLEIRLTAFAIFITLIGGCFFYRHLLPIVRDDFGAAHYWQSALAAIIGLILLPLLWANFVYFLVRLGWLRREARHSPLERRQLSELHNSELPPLTVLIPSYKEDALVVSRALISASLMEYPQKQVVLLIDDVPIPTTESDFLQLEHTRQLAKKIQLKLQEPYHRLQGELQAALIRLEQSSWSVTAETAHLASLYTYAADWLDSWGKEWSMGSHVDAFFVTRIFQEPASQHRRHAENLRHSSHQPNPRDGTELIIEYRRLLSFFDAQLSTFERKRFVNLSHEANKAMNLNSYLGLMGSSWKIKDRDEGNYLQQAHGSDVDLIVPAPKYVITLDADSVLLSEYALRLVAVMEADGNERVAVAQTPYSAFPGATKAIERIAGATTDIQHYVHQGFSAYGGAFWVGANALIRREALEDIAEHKTERGFPVTVYIQNRTVIEDTESSVDLVRKDWRLYNYLDRLAYSETPSDFGSLIIQRRRWANGGLIILPKLLRHCASGRCSVAEAVTRIQYLVSPTTTNLALLLVLLVPFDERLASIWLPIAAAPYFAHYGRDLIRAGYKWSDVARVYALNLLLVPVNLGGVIKSLQQLITGQRTPFGRTPKVSSRTAAPPLYILSVLLLLAAAAFNTLTGSTEGHWARFGFSLLNFVVLGYVIFSFIGIKSCIRDIWEPCALAFNRTPRRDCECGPGDSPTVRELV